MQPVAIAATHVSVVQDAAGLGDIFLFAAGFDRNPVWLFLRHAIADFFANPGSEVTDKTAQLIQ